MKRKMWNRFKDFLYEEGALITWWENTKNNDKNRIKDLLASKSYISFISGAFHWSSSKEGLTYWATLEDKWFKILNEMLNK